MTKHYSPGDIEDNVWAGDLVSKCEFIQYLPFGIMVFREITPFPCLRAVYYAAHGNDLVLNGWDAYDTLNELKLAVAKAINGNPL
jgi:hypothetical protein